MAACASGQDGGKSRVLIGFPSWQEGPIMPARDFRRRSRKKKIARTWAPEGKREGGRPKERGNIFDLGHAYWEAEVATKDRVA